MRFFDKQTNQIKVDKIREIRKSNKVFQLSGDMNDLMSGYLWLRNINFNDLKPRDTIRFKVFYDEILRLWFGLQGKKLLKSRLENEWHIRSDPFYLIMIFLEEAPIIAWISADKDQLPLKIEAQMFFGHAICNLIGYKNIKFSEDHK